MPIYEYRCKDCGKVFARLQTIANPTKTTPCPACGSDQTGRILSTFAAGSSSAGTGSRPSAAAGCGGGGGG